VKVIVSSNKKPSLEGSYLFCVFLSKSKKWLFNQFKAYLGKDKNCRQYNQKVKYSIDIVIFNKSRNSDYFME